LLARLGNPHQKFDAVLVAGTKGKGSVAALTASILQAAGYRTGCYTSPHLHTLRERIKIDGEMISEQSFVAMVNDLKPYIETVKGLTYFEAITALAFLYFAQQGVNLAVLEVGLGGRLDATNASDPAVSVITSISYDHTELLGDTLSLIAREKAGIIRPGALAISAPQVPEAMTMIEEVCEGRHAELVVVGEGEYRWQPGRATLRGQSFELRGERYWIPLLGRHQLANATTALAAVDGMERRVGVSAPVSARKEGLRATHWPGRLEILGHSPYVVVDSAHNGDSAGRLRVALGDFFPSRRVILIFGASRNHPFADALRELAPISHQIFVTRSRHPRAAAPEFLSQTITALGYQSSIVSNVPEALDAALQNATANDLVCVTGSIFTVADAREAWCQRNGLPLPPLDPEL
jgi:dihydrofolate synthase/folylpolyglutamate synthase